MPSIRCSPTIAPASASAVWSISVTTATAVSEGANDSSGTITPFTTVVAACAEMPSAEIQAVKIATKTTKRVRRIIGVLSPALGPLASVRPRRRDSTCGRRSDGPPASARGGWRWHADWGRACPRVNRRADSAVHALRAHPRPDMGGPRPYALAVPRDDDSLGEEVLVSVDGDPSDSSPADLPDDEHRPLEVPGWLQRLAAISWRTLVVVGMLIVIAVVAVRLSTVTASIIFAGLVAATIAPAYRAVRVDRGWTATKAAVVMSVVALTGLALIATLVVLTFAPFVSEFV